MEADLQALFEGRFMSPEALAVRKGAYIFIKDEQGTIEYFEGDEGRGRVESFSSPVVPEPSAVLKGRSANGRGVMTGTVKVIHTDYGDFSKLARQMQAMEQGQILVSETTAPELMQACRKAAAIITDLGGMLSHAAITSRELGIPCLVGVANASKVLKDGDRIEVDAGKGTVRLIKS
jgi:phosphoenolpyruvate synthase/pyruvate phosphate dikinase